MPVDYYKQLEVCQRKVVYLTEQDAEVAAKKHTSRAGRVAHRVYTCPVCFKWHLATIK